MEDLYTCILCDSDNITSVCQQNNFFQCSSCGLIFDNPRPSLKEIADYYASEQQYVLWLSQEGERDKLWERRLKLIQKYVSSGDLLDVGTGIGQFLVHARRAFDVLGTEISKDAIKISREKYGLEILEGSIENIFIDRKFDVISLIHVLEHVPFPRQFIESCLHYLKPNGHIFIAVPNDIENIKTVLKKVYAKVFYKGNKYGKIGLMRIDLKNSQREIHLSHFTSKVLSHLLKSLKMEILEVSLDPFSVHRGIQKWKHLIFYYLCRLIYIISGRNFYETIWIVARKNPSNCEIPDFN